MKDTNKKVRVKWNYKDYMVQVSLIILSVLVALGMDRCNQNLQDESQLEEFMSLIYQELKEEKEVNATNLKDCNNDISDLESALANFPLGTDKSLEAGLRSTLQVIARGVFRTFPPLTYDRMVASGEISLIKDIDIKNKLAAYSAFRQNYLQYDLKEFDKSTLNIIEKIGPNVDLYCSIQNIDGAIIKCVQDKDTFRRLSKGVLGKLYRQATLRAFHIDGAQVLLQQTLDILEEE